CHHDRPPPGSRRAGGTPLPGDRDRRRRPGGGGRRLRCRAAGWSEDAFGDRGGLLVGDARHRVFFPEDVVADVEASGAVAGVEPPEALPAGAVAARLGAGSPAERKKRSASLTALLSSRCWSCSERKKRPA